MRLRRFDGHDEFFLCRGEPLIDRLSVAVNGSADAREQALNGGVVPDQLAPTGSLSAAVIVSSSGELEQLQKCLRCLRDQTRIPDRIVILSDDTRVDRLCLRHANAFRLPVGSSRLYFADPRQRAFEGATEDVLAFLHETCRPGPNWLKDILAEYLGEGVAGVGGPVIVAGGVVARGGASTGRVLPDGRLSRNFSARCRRRMHVDHLSPMNMSFSREAMRRVGGFHGGYVNGFDAGASDLSLRIGKLGSSLVFSPGAAVGAAPRLGEGPRGARKDDFAVSFDETLELARVFGVSDVLVRRRAWTACRLAACRVRGSVGGLRRPALEGARLSSLGKDTAFAALSLLGSLSALAIAPVALTRDVLASRSRRSHGDGRSR